ncbi:MAG: endonuclease/exonuclease/phosphatase family protein [Alistipes sp.]
MGRKATLLLLDNLLVISTIMILAVTVICRSLPAAPISGELQLMLLVAPGLFALNAMLLLWWLLRRRWIVALIPLVALFVGASQIAPHVQPPHFQTPSPSDLRVATLNVHSFMQQPSRGLSVDRIAAMLRSERIDIACFQETVDDPEHPFNYLADRFADYMPYRVREEAMSCFSRYPILSHHYVQFPHSNQSFMSVDLRVGERTVRVLSVHFQSSGISISRRRIRHNYQREMPLDTLCRLLADNSALRATQVAMVQQVIDTTQLPLLVMGDFNDTPASYTYHAISRGLTNAFNSAGRGWSGSYRNLLTIDYIFHDTHFEATECYVWRDERLSDHSPILAGLRFVP